MLVICLFAGSAAADGSAGSAFGTLTTARSLPMGSADIGFGIGLADATSFIGSFTYGVSSHSDFRLRLALVDADGSDTKLAFGADFKYQMIDARELKNGPFDLALQGFFEYYDYDFASILEIGMGVIGSYDFVLQNGRALSPYGRFNARLESFSFDLPAGSTADDSSSDLEIGLSGGVKYELTKSIDAFGEFQIDGNDGVFFGLDFNIM